MGGRETVKTPKEYAEAGGKICPGCGDPVTVFQDRCYACESSWETRYNTVVEGYIDFIPGPKLAAVDNTREDEA